ncbi:TetR/AcrR family transcriptional regulator [Streptomyces sp. NPDC058642]|uniref:TetR/AcrR family transcriptional regulator n=1 Tax=Streptomyces sp. NPDC058642 TaxID=3346572 RepID=UPI00364ABE4F
MGHREDLLEGAKRCLLEKGFLRTTARDIVKESGTNLASIGYHYGSKDALLVQAYVALIEATGHRFEPGGEGEGALATPAGSLERFRQVWTSITSAVGEARAIWMLSFEVVVQGERLAEIRQMLVEAEEQGRSGLLPLFNDILEEEQDKETIDTEGRFYQTLLQGLMVQWVFNPDTATDADQLTEGLRRVAEGFSRS